MSAHGPEVVVIGGGPAGTSAGIALAALGHRVCIIERQRFPRFRIGESLPPKVNSILELLGVEAEVERRAFVSMAGTTTFRGQDPERHLFSPDGTELGLQVDRGAFDELLLEHARQVGCEVRRARVERLLFEGDAVSGVELRAAEGGPLSRLTARWVLDASGGQRVIARRLGLTRRSAEKTVALYARWRGVRPPSDFPPEDTFFEMQEDGWLWSVLLPGGVRSVTVGFDVARLRAEDAHRLYHSAIARSRLLRGVLDGAELLGAPKAHDATWYDASRYAGPGHLLLGDAGFFADPLTSQGVYKALHGGLGAASVVHTAARDAGDAELALEFFDHSQKRLAAEYAELARSFYENSGYEESPFWRNRARAGLESATGFQGPARADKEVRRATFLEQVRNLGGERLALSAAPSLSVEPRPVSSRGLIRRRPSFVDRRRPLALAAIDTPPDLAPGLLYPLLDGRSMSSVFEVYAERSGTPASSDTARRLLESLARLVEEGLIEFSVSV